MSRQYQEIIRILEEQHISTDELKHRNRGQMRPDLIGDNDIA